MRASGDEPRSRTLMSLGQRKGIMVERLISLSQGQSLVVC